MKRPAHGWILAVLSCLAIITLFYWEDQRTLPTPISRVHGSVAGIGGRDDCAQCHGGSERSMAEACFECHRAIEADITNSERFHGSVIEGARERCSICHMEHAGEEFDLVGERSFALAGIEARAAFDHPWPGYDLVGAHEQLDCVDCHERADQPLLLEGQQRFRGLSLACESCHTDSPHEQQMQRDCASCHGQARSFIEIAEFEHDASFPLEGAHAVKTCSECHEPHTEQSIETLASLESPPGVRACEVCHEPPHRTEFLAGQSVFSGASGASACDACHTLKHAAWADALVEFKAVRHAASAFPLEGPHAEQSCEACHDPALPWEVRYPGRAALDCAQCHEDPHGKQFAANSQFPQCADCHGTQAFSPAHFDLVQHALTDFPLLQSHQAVACTGCHESALDERTDRLWNDLDPACASCHLDAHAGAFEPFVKEADGRALQESSQPDCAECHDSKRFGSEATQLAFDHGKWTSFALEHRHGDIECLACHAPQPVDEFGRVFGRIEQVYGELPSTERPCATCHEDPHEGRLVATAPDPWKDAFGCARCHNARDFREASASGFDHDLWTARELQGSHLSLDCEACHQRQAEPDSLGRSFGRPAQLFGAELDQCSTCHFDVHGGVFDREAFLEQVEGRTGCVRCHGEEHFLGTLLLEFDHDLWTQTDLESGHAKQNCQACHPRVGASAPDARSTRKARGRACVDCHGDPHLAQFQRSERNACEDCHQDQSNWKETLFDHDVDSAYPLDAVHQDVACALCHPLDRFPNGREAVRYKPLPMQCADCHRAPGEDPR